MFDTSVLNQKNIKLESVKEVSSEENKLIKIDENSFSGIISLSEIKKGKKDKIEITFNWESIDIYDEEDTKLGKIKGNKFNIPITVMVTQYLGEEIISN